ncbi:DUF2586 family protein [Pelobium manganitolerans]|uniref:DUF2586 family protein n=1 Tax=Pelobium manganitolerans TaxID=1842495 RepID=UPI003FA3B1CB
MGRTGARIKKGQVGNNILNSADAISGLLMSGVAVVGKIALGETVKITSLKQAEAKGLTAEYDSANHVRVHRHIAEFFRMAGEGTELYIMLYPQATTLAGAMADAYAKKLVIEAGGKVKVLAFAYSPADDYEAVAVDGLETDVRAAIPAAQVLADWTLETFRPLHVVLEGRGVDADVANVLDLKDITVAGTLTEYNQVSLMVGQDWDYAETQNAIGKKFADVGTLLGAIASRNVHENIGEVGAVNITDTLKSKWLTAGISSHTKTTAIDADLDDWDAKRYILAWDYQSSAAPGYRFNNDHVCAPVVEDAEGNLNESSIALSRTNAKVIRGLRDVYLPKVKSVQPVDPATGKLTVGALKYLGGLGDDLFSDMQAVGQIAGGVTIVDPESNLVSGEKILYVDFKWTPNGTIGEVSGTVNIKSNLS